MAAAQKLGLDAKELLEIDTHLRKLAEALEYAEKLQKPKYLSKSTQLEIWRRLAGTWEDNRSAKEIIEDIYTHRTVGRDVKL